MVRPLRVDGGVAHSRDAANLSSAWFVGKDASRVRVGPTHMEYIDPETGIVYTISDDAAELQALHEKFLGEAADEWMEKFVEDGDAILTTTSLAIHLTKHHDYTRDNFAELLAIAIAVIAKERLK